MSDFHKGDQVRIGKGKVEYTVFADQLTRDVFVQSNNTGKITEVDMDRLVLVQAAEDVAYEAGCSVEELTDLADPVTTTASVVDPITVPAKKNDHRDSSYGRAILFALNKLGKHVYAGTAKSKRKVKK